MNNLHATFFIDHGFLLVNDWFTTVKKSSVLEEAITASETILKTLNTLPTSKETANEWIQKKVRLESSKEFLALFETVQPFLQRHVMTSCGLASKQSRCQIAARFPGENKDD